MNVYVYMCNTMGKIVNDKTTVLNISAFLNTHLYHHTTFEHAT